MVLRRIAIEDQRESAIASALPRGTDLGDISSLPGATTVAALQRRGGVPRNIVDDVSIR
jgi:hypothetical protein